MPGLAGFVVEVPEPVGGRDVLSLGWGGWLFIGRGWAW